jgi:hypothetical protein
MMEQNSYHLPKLQKNCQDFLQKTKIDSFKLRIPTEKVTVVSSTFREKFQKLYLTGEIDSDISLENHKTDITNGITARMGYAVSRYGKEETEVFYFQLNSKMCKERYFDGIGKDTIKLVYEYIMALKVVYVPYEDFLNGYVSDIDFAYDVAITPNHLVALNQRIFEKVIESKAKYVDKPFRKQDNVGIAFNKREKATPSTPYIKIYHKGLELQSKSKEFYDAYLSAIDAKNVGRLEYTLKNSKHQKHLGIEVRTLNELLNMDKPVIEGIVLSGIKENYLEKALRNIDYTKLSPMEKMIKYYMDCLIIKGCDRQDLYAALNVFDNNSNKERKDKSLMRKKIASLIEESAYQEKLDKNEELASAIRAFGLGGVI